MKETTKYVSNIQLLSGKSVKVFISLVVLTLYIIPLNATTYYVSLSGDNDDTGTSPGSAWRTISFAANQAQAGDTVYIKAGNYGEEYVEPSRSGTVDNPIVYEGYKNTPGDIPEPEPFDIYHEGGLPAPELDPAEMPMLQGTFAYDPGFNLSYRSHLELKNIQIENYFEGIWGIDVNNITLNNIVMSDCQYPEYNSGYGIHLKNCSDCSVLNCMATDCDMTGIALKGARNTLIENCRVHDKPGGIIGGYFISLTGASRDSYGNTIRHCLAQDNDDEEGGHHGIGLKGEGYNLYNNTFEDCVSRDFDKGFYVRHSNVYDNTFINCATYGFEGFVCRDGAHNNTFINCKGSSLQNGILFYDTDEDGGQNDCSGRNNTFVNCIFEDCHNGVFFADCEYIDAAALNNTFRNCVFADGTTLIYHETHGNDGNIFQNCIITGFTNLEDGSGWGDVDITYSDFWNNDFTTPSGTGNLGEDPLFADPSNGDYHLKSGYGRWNGSSWVIDAVTSPCIDAGDPANNYSDEPEPNGGRINVGAYGNTNEASKSFCSGIEDNINTFPETYALYQNYPNPFNPSTVISYQLSAISDVELTVYNSLGQKVHTLVNEQKPVGEYNVTWEGKDAKDNKVASGVYFYRLTAGNQVFSKKMLYLQ